MQKSKYIDNCIAILYNFHMDFDINKLKKELKNNQNKQKTLENKLEFLPKGHINTLYRNNKGYYYVTYREGKKIRNDYLGPVGKCDLNPTFERMKLRKQKEEELKELKKEEKDLIKAINKAHEISQK